MSREKIKLAVKLGMKKYRDELKLFTAEGLRLCEAAADFSKVEFGFFTEDFLKNERAEKLIARLEKFSTLEKISESDFKKISDTKTPQGIFLVVRQKFSAVEEVTRKNLIVVLDGVQDPGNVGTILRTAEAFNCGVILLDGTADIFNQKVVRSSMGAIFNLSVIKLTHKNFLQLVKAQNFDLTAAALDSAAEIYFCHDFTKKNAVVFGSEATGVSNEILSAAKKIFIPMSGKAESLNVATAASIIISEAARQNFS